MPSPRRLAKQRLVLQLADDSLEPFVAVQGHVLRVIVANAAEAAAGFPRVDGGAAEAAGIARRRRHVERSL